MRVKHVCLLIAGVSLAPGVPAGEKEFPEFPVF
jgi:hypothetical protein